MGSAVTFAPVRTASIPVLGSIESAEHRPFYFIALPLAVGAVAALIVLACMVLVMSPALARRFVAAAMPVLVRMPVLSHRAGHFTPERVVELAGIILLYEALPTIACMLLELAGCGWQRSSLRRLVRCDRPSQVVDVALFGIRCLGLVTIAALVLTLGASYFFDSWSELSEQYFASLHWRLHSGWIGLDFAIFYLGYTFVAYWAHRLEHFGPFWYLHRFHHSAAEMSTITYARANPAELSMTRLVRTCVGIFVGCPPQYLIAFLILGKAHDQLIHSDARWEWGWFGRWIVISPMRHRVHHSVLPAHTDRNFGILPLWDRLFGTYCGDTVGDTLGITDHADYRPSNLFKQMALDSCTFVVASLSAVAKFPRLLERPRESTSPVV